MDTDFLFLKLLVWRNLSYGNYLFLICKLITAALSSLALLIIHKPLSASYLTLFLAQSLKPQRETAHVNCQRSFSSASSKRHSSSPSHVRGTGPSYSMRPRVTWDSLEAWA